MAARIGPLQWVYNVAPLMVIDWLVFPLVVLAVSLGCGLIVERLGGWRMSGVLVTGIGLAAIIVVASLLTQSQTLAPLTPWVVLGLAVIGYASSLPRLRELRVDPWGLGVALVLFGLFAAPVVTSGQATFLGYGVDGDPAFHFLLARELLAHGHRSSATLPFQLSVPVQLMHGYLTTGYPFGADVALGALRLLLGEDIAWVYDPYIAVTLVLGALTIDELLREAVRSRPLRALCAFVAGQAGLAYSFYLISSIKELIFTWLMTLLVTVSVRVLARPPSARALVPVVVVVASALYTLATPAAPWLAVPLLVFVIASLARVRGSLRRPSRRALAAVALVLAAGVAITLPVLHNAVLSYRATTGTLSSDNAGAAIGNLYAPLNTWQILGIWPSGDYRLPVTLHIPIVYTLLWLAAVSGVLGALWTLRRRAWGPLLLLIGNGLAALVLLERSTPYAASKVMAILSITAVLAAMLGAVALHDHVRPWLGWALAAVLALAVLWTNDKSFRQAPIGPRPRMAELSRIDQRFAGVGPTFYNLWDFEWPAYFLRHLGTSMPNIYSEPMTVPGTRPRNAFELQIPWDPDDLEPAYLDQFRLLVLARSPIGSRPPANFRPVFEGRYYDVYRRTGGVRVLTHVSVTDGPDSALYRPPPLSCRRIQSLGARAGAEHAHLVAAVSPAVASVKSRDSAHPDSWVTVPRIINPIPGGLVLSNVGGTLIERIRVPHSGRYTVWVQGTFTQALTVGIAGHTIGTLNHAIGPAGLFSVVGSVALPAGRHTVVIRRAGASRWKPASVHDALGQLVLTRGGGPPLLRTVPARHAASLCGRPLQWIEIVR